MIDVLPQHQLDALSLRITAIEALQTRHVEQTERIENNTKELIETFNALRGAWTVLNWLGKLAKPVTVIIAAGGSWYWLKDHIKDWTLK